MSNLFCRFSSKFGINFNLALRFVSCYSQHCIRNEKKRDFKVELDAKREVATADSNCCGSIDRSRNENA